MEVIPARSSVLIRARHEAQKVIEEGLTLLGLQASEGGEAAGYPHMGAPNAIITALGA